ncbi:MAG TPA: hypothetical protein DDW91_01955, partial [Shewanella frigidimarina]|nr:hypothetical protein [Shewanella frigidimarina]
KDKIEFVIAALLYRIDMGHHSVMSMISYQVYRQYPTAKNGFIDYLGHGISNGNISSKLYLFDINLWAYSPAKII